MNVMPQIMVTTQCNHHFTAMVVVIRITKAEPHGFNMMRVHIAIRRHRILLLWALSFQTNH
jgi:hypothetical protein